MQTENQPQKRLGPFIIENMESILVDWEAFARTLWHGPLPSSAALRNDAAKMLTAVVKDMETDQTIRQQKEKSQGIVGRDTVGLNAAAAGHALARVNDNFDIQRMVAEFRALRATVTRLWWASTPSPHEQQIEDMGRFNEGLDQLLAASVSAFTERVDQSRRMFMGILGHDLRQPLTSILMFSDVLLSPKAPADPRPVVAGIRRCSDSMARMLTDLLDFTSSQLGSDMPVHPISCDIGAVCEELVQEMRTSAPGAAFYYKASGDTSGTWDPVRLRQLISNLLSNSLQHGDPRGPVTASIHGGEDEVTLKVHNFGKAVPSEAIGTLFDPMVRVAASDAHRPHGSVGLGLYICREIATAHGGDISVTSSAEEGTTFAVRLPRQAFGRS
jgi:signal transduction histidine kinase